LLTVCKKQETSLQFRVFQVLSRHGRARESAPKAESVITDFCNWKLATAPRRGHNYLQSSRLDTHLYRGAADVFAVCVNI
jgi:hypothetical protein